jgi:hypothetical protein
MARMNAETLLAHLKAELGITKPVLLELVPDLRDTKLDAVARGGYLGWDEQRGCHRIQMNEQLAVGIGLINGLAHELTHALQCERYGLDFDALHADYEFERIQRTASGQHRDRFSAYRAVSFEVEARQNGTDAVKRLAHLLDEGDE